MEDEVPTLIDAGAPPDRAPALGPDAAADVEPDAELPAFGISGVDSLAIDSDGTLYFDQNDTVKVWIARRMPGGLPQLEWVAVPTGLPTRGLAIDTTHRTLYLTAGMTAPVLQVIDIDATFPAVRTIATGLTNPNDLALGPDGNVYLSEQGDGHIYRFTPAGARTKVTKTPIGDPANANGPAALAFGADGSLYVGVQEGGPIVRLQLTNGLEVGRANYGAFNDWANGLAFDQAGRLYAALYSLDQNKSVVRLDSDKAAPVTVLTGKWFSRHGLRARGAGFALAVRRPARRSVPPDRHRHAGATGSVVARALGSSVAINLSGALIWPEDSECQG